MVPEEFRRFVAKKLANRVDMSDVEAQNEGFGGGGATLPTSLALRAIPRSHLR